MSYQLPSNITFTDEQVQAIMDDGNNILVSAAAGCGKTTLMVERIIRKLIQDKVNIDELVVVTFTEAAASELKVRLEVEISNRLLQNPNDSFLKHQLEIINDCYIMTFHSLCMRLLSENQLSFKFDKAIKISDKIELETIKYKTYSSFFDNNLSNCDFALLNEYYNNFPLDIKPLYTILCEIIDTCTNKSSLDTFIKTNNNNKTLNLNNIFDYPHFNNLLIEASNFYIDNIINLLNQMILNDDNTKLLDQSQNTIELFINLKDKLYNKDYHYLHDTLRQYKLFRKPPKLLDHTKANHDKIKKDYLDKLIELYYYTNEEMIHIINTNHNNSEILLKYASLFNKELSKSKLKNGTLEFNDLEQYALELLYDGDCFSTVALRLQDHFNEIMIDEYQDTNLIQEKIVRALSNSKNMFMVGDLKQSIYRFRNATSQLFSDKYYQFSNGNNGKVINLSFNFRSKNEVLEMTNYIFKNTFSKTIGGIDYDDNAKLYFKNKALDKFIGDFRTTLLLNNNLKNSDDKKLSSMDLSSQMITSEINELIENGAHYSDIAILFRSRNKINILETQLINNAIPYTLHGSSGFYSVYEVKDIISMLKTIINPKDDISLLSVLRSYFFNLNEQDLLNISLTQDIDNKYPSIYQRLSLNHDYSHIYETISKLRNYYYNNTPVDLINYIYDETNYLAYFLNNHNYEQFLININMLKDIITNNYDYFNNLSYFIKQIASNLKANFDSDLPATISSNQDVVNLMTIHKSKGLEFKYVFILDETNYRFDSAFSKFKYYANQLVIDHIDHDNIIYNRNPLNNLIVYNERKEIIAEELRILYVALTRAKLKLYICANISLEQLDNYVNTIINEKEFLLSNNIVLNFKRNLDPIILSMIRHKDGRSLKDGQPLSSHDDIYYYNNDLFIVKNFELFEEKSSENNSIFKRYPIKIVDKKISINKTNEHLKPSQSISNKLDFNNINSFDPYLEGSNVHKVLELLDFKSIDIAHELHSLSNKFMISKVNIDGIDAFINNDFFKTIISNKYYKEYAFSYTMDDKLINGIIDLLVITNDTTYIIDYKSDNLTIDELKEHYYGQLNLYYRVLRESEEFTSDISVLIYSIKHKSYIKIT